MPLEGGSAGGSGHQRAGGMGEGDGDSDGGGSGGGDGGAGGENRRHDPSSSVAVGM